MVFLIACFASLAQTAQNTVMSFKTLRWWQGIGHGRGTGSAGQ